jgi:hypothetical protein
VSIPVSGSDNNEVFASDESGRDNDLGREVGDADNDNDDDDDDIGDEDELVSLS